MKKRDVFFFVLGALIFGTIGVAASTLFRGSDISYDKSKTNLNSDNVQDAIDEMYDKVTFGDAGSGNILEGKTALVNGNKVTGTMANNGSLNPSALNAGGSYTIPAGYTSGGTISANSLASQTSGTATASDIASGKTAWVNGSKVTGTVTNSIDGIKNIIGRVKYSSVVEEKNTGTMDVRNLNSITIKLVHDGLATNSATVKVNSVSGMVVFDGSATTYPTTLLELHSSTLKRNQFDEFTLDVTNVDYLGFTETSNASIYFMVTDAS